MLAIFMLLVACSSDAVLTQVLCNKLGHLKHVDRLLTTKYALKSSIRIDVALVLRILKLVLLNVRPQLLRDLCSWKRCRTYNLRKL